MPSRLSSFLFSLPMVLLVLVLLLWARSYLPDQMLIRSNHGSVVLFFVTGRYLDGFDSPNGRWRITDDAMNFCRQTAASMSLPSFRFAGFEYTNLNFKSSYPGFIAIPYWAITALLAVFSLWAFLRRRGQRDRLLPGHCRACGYDLRGVGETCPECGSPTSLATMRN
jgi:hypothetical protein